jgi:hypothetical protein
MTSGKWVDFRKVWLIAIEPSIGIEFGMGSRCNSVMASHWRCQKSIKNAFSEVSRESY